MDVTSGSENLRIDGDSLVKEGGDATSFPAVDQPFDELPDDDQHAWWNRRWDIEGQERPSLSDLTLDPVNVWLSAGADPIY